MINFFYELNPIIQSLIAGIFTFLITALGSASVFLFKKFNKLTLDCFLSISAGVMIAASFFSLINPSIEMAKNLEQIPIVVLLIGILGGTFLLFLGDKFFQKKINKNKTTSLLIFSIVLHNIPEDCIHYVSLKRNIILVKKMDIIVCDIHFIFSYVFLLTL